MSTVGDILMVVGGILAFIAFVFIGWGGVRTEKQGGHMDMRTYGLVGFMIKVGAVGLLLLVIGFIITKL